MRTSGAPSLHGDDGRMLAQDAEARRLRDAVLDPLVDVGLPLVVALRSRLLVVERVAAAVQVDLASRLLLPRD